MSKTIDNSINFKSIDNENLDNYIVDVVNTNPDINIGNGGVGSELDVNRITSIDEDLSLRHFSDPSKECVRINSNGMVVSCNLAYEPDDPINDATFTWTNNNGALELYNSKQVSNIPAFKFTDTPNQSAFLYQLPLDSDTQVRGSWNFLRNNTSMVASHAENDFVSQNRSLDRILQYSFQNDGSYRMNNLRKDVSNVVQGNYVITRWTKPNRSFKISTEDSAVSGETDIAEFGATQSTISTPLQYTGTTPTDGYVLTTDATGNASWQAPAPVDEATIDHNALLNYNANEHIDWTNASDVFRTSGEVRVLSNTNNNNNMTLIYFNNRNEIEFTNNGNRILISQDNGNNFLIQSFSPGVGILFGHTPFNNQIIIGQNRFILDLNQNSISLAPNGTGRVSVNDTTTSISNTLQYTGSTPTDGHILTCDASGNASWQAPPSGAVGEVNTASNVGTGVGVFKQKTGVDLEFNSLIGGTGINITNTIDDLTITTTDFEIDHNNLFNYQTNEHIDWTNTNEDLKTTGTLTSFDIQLTQLGSAGDVLVRDAAGFGIWQAPSGESNTASNVGTGVGVFKQKTGVDLEFNSLIGGTGINITNTIDDLTITTNDAGINHNALLNYVANEHIDWTNTTQNLSTSGNVECKQIDLSITQGSPIGSITITDLSPIFTLVEHSISGQDLMTLQEASGVYTFNVNANRIQLSNDLIGGGPITNIIDIQQDEITIGGSIKPNTNSLHDIGEINNRFFNVYSDNVDIGTSLKYVDGNQTAGASLMSDANGNASWMLPRMGDIYWENNATATSISTGGVFVKASVGTGLTILNVDSLGSWSLNGVENRLQYTGTMGGFGHVGSTLSISGGNGQIYQAYLAKNGTKIPGSLIEFSTANATAETSTAIHCMTNITQNDFLELWITNTASADTVIVLHANIFCMLMGSV